MRCTVWFIRVSFVCVSVCVCSCRHLYLWVKKKIERKSLKKNGFVLGPQIPWDSSRLPYANVRTSWPPVSLDLHHHVNPSLCHSSVPSFSVRTLLHSLSQSTPPKTHNHPTTQAPTPVKADSPLHTQPPSHPSYHPSQSKLGLLVGDRYLSLSGTRMVAENKLCTQPHCFTKRRLL